MTTILGGCRGKKEVVLPFETIERADTPGTGEEYEGEEPKLAIIAEAGKINALEDTVSSDALAQLRDMDFDQYFAVAVFQGWQPQLPPPPSGVEIQRISKKRSTITIYAHFHEPAGEVWRPVEISPYHLVRVQRGKEMQGEIKFVLNVDGTVVSQQDHHLP